MNTDDLMKLLGVKPGAAPRLPKLPQTRPTPSPGPDSAPAAAGPVESGIGDPGPASPTALILDEWDLGKGSDLDRTDARKLGAEAWADLFGTCFLRDPQLAPAPADRRRAQFVRGLLESPDHAALRESTRLNVSASEAAARKFADEYVKLLQGDRGRNAQRQLPGLTPKQRAKLDKQDDLGVVRAVGAAVAQAADDVDRQEEVVRAFGGGCGSQAGDDSGIDPAVVLRAFERNKNNALVRAAVELAGAYRRCAQGKQKNKQVHGYDDLVGVTVGGDPARLLTSELARLDDPLLELELLERLDRKRALVREHRGVEKVGKGPFVLWVDESDSMGSGGYAGLGESKIAHAKAFALAMSWVARHQHRWFVLGGFASAHQGFVRAFPPRKFDPALLMDWVGHFYQGGTSLQQPLQETQNLWPEFLAQGMPRGKTDMILLTDGVVPLERSLAQSFREFKAKEKVRLITLGVGVRDAGEVAKVSDGVYCMPRLGIDQAGVETCLSL